MGMSSCFLFWLPRKYVIMTNQWQLDDSKFHVCIIKNRVMCKSVPLEALWLSYVPPDLTLKFSTYSPQMKIVYIS
jgi:hypothetical protein